MQLSNKSMHLPESISTPILITIFFLALQYILLWIQNCLTKLTDHSSILGLEHVPNLNPEIYAPATIISTEILVGVSPELQ